MIAVFDKQIYFNEASRYTVMRMRTDDPSVPQKAKSPYTFRDRLTRFTAVGYGLPQTDSVKLEIEGDWKEGKHGLQFQVEHWHELVPSTQAGLLNYLSSGLLKGIGESTARSIVQRFGAETLDVLEYHPEKLLEVRGITEQKLEGIRACYAESSGVAVAMEQNLSIITGGPGTGKTTVLKAVIEVYRLLHPKNRIVLAAPTGKASRRMAQSTGILDAMTLHSLLGLQGEFCSKGKQEKPLDVDFLIVDEASMVDMWLAHQLFTRLRAGTKLLLLGDVDQLESVGAGSVFAELIGSGIVPVTVLDEIFRQSKDSLIAYNARFINEENSSLFYGTDFQFVKAENQEEAAEQIQTLYLQELQNTSIGQLQIISPYRTDGEASSNALNARIRETVNPHTDTCEEFAFGERVFRLHDRVMQTKNNYELRGYDTASRQEFKGVFNGDIGSIRRILPDKLCVDYDGRIVEYSKNQLGDLELAYAITIHKSMGSEYETVIIPVLMAHRILLTKNLIYTAVTRAKKRVILVGQKRALFLAIHSGGKVAGDARKAIEQQTGVPVITSENAVQLNQVVTNLIESVESFADGDKKPEK